jgi:type IV pilus assembly protein PilY1
LGDTVHAQPQYVATPPFAFADAGPPPYGPIGTAGTFQNANASRQPVLYVGGNDGMLHAFNAKTGSELWAYVPRMVWSSLYVLADVNYATLHQYYLDGSPVMMDAFFTRGSPTPQSWHTVLVGGLSGGGRGYYALDITNPTAPVALWEFCSSSSVCNVSDADLGLTFGNPVITKRASDGRWVVLVTSGYNNVSPGTGQEFLYVLDLATGQILQKLGTGSGSTTAPSGLAKINVWADNFNLDNTGKYVYGGDLIGNVWRFDLTALPATVMKLGVLTDASGNPQPVTTRPELGDVQGNRVVYIGTGEYLGMSDLTNTNTESLYAFKDQGTLYGNIRTSANLVKQTLISSSATTRTTTTLPVDWNSQNGWYVDFPTGGERVNLDPQLVLGTLEVITNIPGTAACTVGGSSWLYDFDYMNGQYIPGVSGNTAGTYNANSVLVGDTIYQLPSGGLYGLAKPPGTPVPPHGVPTPPGPASGKRTGWRQL